MRHALNFPDHKPDSYIRLPNEPVFNAATHLALSQPQSITSLADLGYSAPEIAACPSPLGITSAFRIFSDEGLAVMQELTRQMKSNRNTPAGTGSNRLGSYIRGAGYRSQFIRDFCACREWLEFLSALAGMPLAQHSVPAVACGINYAPDDVSKAVDNWHVDSVAFDVVILLTDPSTFQGGEFQYFSGTRAEGEALGGSGEAGVLTPLPADRIHTADFIAAGYGFMQQGNKVFHRACRLLQPAERVTMIPSFVPLQGSAAQDGTNISVMKNWSDPGIKTELARHAAWLSRDELQHLIDTLPLNATDEQIAAQLENAIGGIQQYIAQLRHMPDA